MDLANLNAFIAIAEARNLTHGAAQVHLSPSTASHCLRKLEQALGAALFVRQPRGVVLTLAVGPTVGLRVVHALQQRTIEIAPPARVEHSCDSAHASAQGLVLANSSS